MFSFINPRGRSNRYPQIGQLPKVLSFRYFVKTRGKLTGCEPLWFRLCESYLPCDIHSPLLRSLAAGAFGEEGPTAQD